jgi:anti-anti-sigma factor
MPLTLSSRHCGNVIVIECNGRIAVGEEAGELDAALVRASRESSRLVLNVVGVDRLDSTGIGLIVRHATNLRKIGGDLRLASAPSFLSTLVSLANLSGYLQLYPTEDEAILSFLKHSPTRRTPASQGPRVLFFDQSADLCAFVRTVLAQHGFDVRSTSNFGDAKILLRVDDVDYVLVGPGTPQLSSESALKALRAVAPKAAALTLSSDFKGRDAGEAAETLLQMFGSHPA